jgi:SH3 domain-containing YSC84-like protein 1
MAVERTELDARVRALTAKFEEMQSKPDKAIPSGVLRKAQGIILLDRTKAGFVFAYQGGGGVAMVKDPRSGNWGPVAFLGASEASLGFQVGGEQNFYVILLMNTNATGILTDPNFDFGGEARGTAGDTTSGVEGKVSTTEEPILVYDDRKGLYGGAAVKGGALTPDEQANNVYYGDYFTMKDILFDHKVQPTEDAVNLAKRINSYAQTREDTKSAQN